MIGEKKGGEILTRCSIKLKGRGVRGHSPRKIWRFEHTNNSILSTIFLHFPKKNSDIYTFSNIGTYLYVPGLPGQGLKIGIVPLKSGQLAGLRWLSPNAKPKCEWVCFLVEYRLY